VEYIQLECSILDSIGYSGSRTRIKVFYKYGPKRRTHMVIMSRALVFLNCDIGAERAIIGNAGYHLRLSNHGVAELVRWILATIL
jgi:hypothetical protein